MRATIGKAAAAFGRWARNNSLGFGLLVLLFIIAVLPLSDGLTHLLQFIVLIAFLVLVFWAVVSSRRQRRAARVAAANPAGATGATDGSGTGS